MARIRLFVVLALMTALALGGCSSPEPGQGPAGESEETSPTDEGPSFEMVAPPGIYDLPGGETQALGILTYRDLEGGFWAVARTAIPAEAATAELVAVVLPAEGLEVDLQTMNGEYVSVVGMRDDGPSIYMAGPIIRARAVEIVTDMPVE